MAYENITGQKFGKWQVIERDKDKSLSKNQSYWICECECGQTKSIRLYLLKSKKTTQCSNCYNSNRPK